MSNDKSELLANIGAVIMAVIGISIVLAFLYGILVYNHGQDIKRDEFYATHCSGVTRTTDFNGVTSYKCGTK